MQIYVQRKKYINTIYKCEHILNKDIINIRCKIMYYNAVYDT